MADRIVRVAGTEIVLETSGGALSDGTITEMTDATITAANVTQGTTGGAYTATFEVDIPTWTGTPTAGNVLSIVEQKINSDVADGFDPSTTYLRDTLVSWSLPLVSAGSGKLRTEGVPINLMGGKYWIYWADGGAGTVAIPATWACRAIIEDTQSETV